MILPLIPTQNWETMTDAEQKFYRSLPEEKLISRWKTKKGKKIIENIISINLKHGESDKYKEFIGTIKTDFAKKKKAKYDLRGISFKYFNNLSGNEIFGFDFSNCSLQFSNFEHSRFSSSSFKYSDILYCNLSHSIFDLCDFSNTNITLSNCSESTFEFSNFKDCWMSNANFKNSDLGYVQFNKKTTFYNLNIDCFEGTTNPLFINHIKRNHYLNHFKEHNRTNAFIYYIWLLASDCGNSFIRWLLTSSIIIIFFGKIFSLIDYKFMITSNRLPTSFTYYYYSIVTFTTLGYGYITPKTISSEILVSIEVILGYLMLGGLISIFANKFIPKI